MQRNIKQLLNEKFEKVDRLDAELLLSYVIKKPREFLMTHDEKIIGKLEKFRFNKFVKKRRKGIPLAYLTGTKEFYGLDFFVNRHTLIPRPDTELIVDLALTKLQSMRDERQIMLIDIGTGSGCIPIAIAKKERQYDNTEVYATDISRNALKVAKQNTKRHSIDITLKHGHLLKPLYSKIKNFKSKIILTANLPYLTEEQFKNESSIRYEPKSALVAKDNGLSLYTELLLQLKDILHYTSSITALFEINPTQSTSIKTIARRCIPNADISMQKDLAKLDRVIIISISS